MVVREATRVVKRPNLMPHLSGRCDACPTVGDRRRKDSPAVERGELDALRPQAKWLSRQTQT